MRSQACTWPLVDLSSRTKNPFRAASCQKSNAAPRAPGRSGPTHSASCMDFTVVQDSDSNPHPAIMLTRRSQPLPASEAVAPYRVTDLAKQRHSPANRLYAAWHICQPPLLVKLPSSLAILLQHLFFIDKNSPSFLFDIDHLPKHNPSHQTYPSRRRWRRGKPPRR